MRQVSRDGIRWQVSEPAKNSEWSFWNEFEAAIWEQETLDVVDRFVTDGSTFIDVGCWAAPIAMWAASRHDCNVIAIEPDPVALDYANLNVLANGMYDRITIVDGAIAGHTGTTHIAPHEFGWGSTMTQLAAEGREITCWKLPDLLHGMGVDLDTISLVKVDVEGAEALFLEELAPFLASHEIPLFVSMHEPWWPQPVLREWLDCYSEVQGNFGWFNSLTCLP